MDELVIEPVDRGGIFLRTDRREQQREVNKAHRIEALHRWCIRNARGEARRANSGLVYSRPVVEVERELSIRGTQWCVWTSCGLIPGRPGEEYIIPNTLDKFRLPEELP